MRPLPANRRICNSRAMAMRCRTVAELSDSGGAVSFSYSTLGTSTKISIRSMRGPEIRRWYRETIGREHEQECAVSPWKPHGHGFIAPTSMKLAGNVTVPCALLIVTTLSSSGWRRTSSDECPNSGSSSRNSTPRWARVISPGRGTIPPPTSPAFEMV